MGRQVYDSEIQAALRRVAGEYWTFHSIAIRPVRSRMPEARRVPFGLNERAPLGIAVALGTLTYRTRELVHRFHLECPPFLGKEVITLHDFPPARFDDEGRAPRAIAAGARRARACICPSEFAAQEARELFGISRIHVIPYGLSSAYKHPKAATDEVLGKLGISSPFMIHAAGATKRKNLAGLAEAWREVAPRYPELQLVLCGPRDPRRTEAFFGLPRIVMPGRIAASTLSAVMCRAEAVLVPSVYEGFGLPALEGMACGVPVVAARAGALPEVCKEAALLVAPTGGAIAEGIRRILEDRDLGHRLRVNGPMRAREFSWEAAARAHLNVYEEVLEH